MPIISSTPIKSPDTALNQWPRVLHHLDVSEDKASLRAGWVKTLLKGTDQTKVGVLHSDIWVLELVVVQRVRASVLHERLETSEAGADGKGEGNGAREGLATESVGRLGHVGDVARLEEVGRGDEGVVSV